VFKVDAQDIPLNTQNSLQENYGSGLLLGKREKRNDVWLDQLKGAFVQRDANLKKAMYKKMLNKLLLEVELMTSDEEN
jgi:hypothetical protein